jgi:branched-chain amino acid transport system ATP-binding protein
VSSARLFEATGITVSFGELRALDELSVSVGEGRIVGLIGPNGAGKTTFIDAVTGFTACRGRVRFGDRDLTGSLPHERARAGLARTWQAGELFDDLTVAENLEAVAHHQGVASMLRDLVWPRRGHERERVHDAFDAVGISDLAGRLPSELSHGQRVLVGVARAMATAPRLVCMDEPAAGLDSGESDLLGTRLRSIAAGGTSVLLVDHDMGLVLRYCDEIYVIDFGQLIAHGTPAEIRSDAAVIAAYLGSAVER